ncbi:MAG: (Fe-S)-binding protein [Candidatus Nanoarchaeia archaeon]|nr:(Fe-S)-binding protein [Candidatus Nanoarchaeia archaeon]MDD5740772.1 (Fe-S)-binding protein [Candidatus Nanoarchaeia archaeon]
MGIFSRLGFVQPDTIYYPGCMTYFKHKDNYELYKKIFSKLGIEVTWSENIVCCGLPALEMGYESEARKLARKKFELLKENKIKRIITNCSACYKMFKQNYPELLPDWDIDVVDMWKLILDNLVDKPKLIKNMAGEKITYHDSCYLGRYCGIYDEPRKILELIGYTIVEMIDSRENSICAGSCGSLVIINPELADKIARQRLLQAKRAGVKKMVVASMKNYDLLKKNAEGLGIEIAELSDVLANALNIKIPERSEESKQEPEENSVMKIEREEKIEN